jgi:hypothetical protein
MRHTVLFAIVLALFTVSVANADSIHYTINFSPIDDPAPSGSFTYDANVPVFTNFLVTWQGLPYNFTSAANLMGSPNSGGRIQGVVPCLGGQTGAAASFALLSGACNQPGWNTIWDVGVVATDASHFDIFSASFSSNDHISLNLIGAFSPGLDPAARGTWTITPTSLPVPEPSVLSVLLTGLGAIALLARKAKRS